jgi:hypothetical protein
VAARAAIYKGATLLFPFSQRQVGGEPLRRRRTAFIKQSKFSVRIIECSVPSAGKLAPRYIENLKMHPRMLALAFAAMGPLASAAITPPCHVYNYNTVSNGFNTGDGEKKPISAGFEGPDAPLTSASGTPPWALLLFYLID